MLAVHAGRDLGVYLFLAQTPNQFFSFPHSGLWRLLLPPSAELLEQPSPSNREMWEHTTPSGLKTGRLKHISVGKDIVGSLLNTCSTAVRRFYDISIPRSPLLAPLYTLTQDNWVWTDLGPIMCCTPRSSCLALSTQVTLTSSVKPSWLLQFTLPSFFLVLTIQGADP